MNDLESINVNNRVNDNTRRTTMTIEAAIRFIIFLLIGVITYFAFARGITLFSWHPTLMTIGVSV